MLEGSGEGKEKTHLKYKEKTDQGNTASLQRSAEEPSEIDYSGFIPIPICRALWFSSGTMEGIAGFSCPVTQQGVGKHFTSALGVAVGRTLTYSSDVNNPTMTDFKLPM